jgi:hypothetical protein
MGGGGCVLITQPQAMRQVRSVWGEKGGGVGEQQIRALGNPCSSFSSSSSSLCIRRRFDKNSTLGSAVHFETSSKIAFKNLYIVFYFHAFIIEFYSHLSRTLCR